MESSTMDGESAAAVGGGRLRKALIMASSIFAFWSGVMFFIMAWKLNPFMALAPLLLLGAEEGVLLLFVDAGGGGAVVSVVVFAAAAAFIVVMDVSGVGVRSHGSSDGVPSFLALVMVLSVLVLEGIVGKLGDVSVGADGRIIVRNVDLDNFLMVVLRMV